MEAADQMKHSTGKPTKSEEARIVAAKEGPCMACLVRCQRGDIDSEMVFWGGDYNHCKSGNRRRGHMFGYNLCRYHHMRHPPEGWTHSKMRQIYGPSLMDGSHLFHATYGSDDELIDLQTETTGI